MRKNKNFKKLIIFAMTAIMVLGSITIAVNAAYKQIGTGTSTEPYIPVYTYYDYGWSHVLYLQSQIGQAIEITGLSYYVSSYSGTFPHTINNCMAFIKHSTDTSLTSTKPDSSTYQQVYAGGFTVTQLGWNTIWFNMGTFLYDNINNLDIYWENWDGDYDYPYPYFQYTSTSPVRAVYDYQDGSMPTTTGHTSSYLTNIRLQYKADHDAAITKIISPDLMEGTGTVPVRVEVKNVGLNTETFDVNVKILSNPVTLLSEGFESVTRPNPPFGWVIQDANGDGYTSGSYAYNRWGTYYGYAHTGLNSMRYEYGSITADDWFFTPGLSLSPGTVYTVSWWDRCYSSSYNEKMQVWIGSGQAKASMTTKLWEDAAMKHTTYRLDSVSFTVPSSGTYYLGWCEASPPYYYHVFVDDITISYQTALYDQTVTMTNLGVNAISEANLPDWIINTPGTYTVRAEAILATDGDTSNNIMTQTCTIGTVDASLDSIDIPQPLMGPAPFSPVVTVSNLGTLDFDGVLGQLPVHAWVMDPTGGSGVCYSEDFEGTPQLSYYDKEIEIFMNPDDIIKDGDYVRFPGSIKWLEEEEDQPGFGDPADWTILNPDNNGGMWHTSTYRSSSPTQSMYCGDEVTHQYLPNSGNSGWFIPGDILISPRIHVGVNGGTFSFDIYNDVEGYNPYKGYPDYGDFMIFGTSPDGMTWNWWFGSSWWMNWQTIGGITIYPWDVDANGDTYVSFAFMSDSSYQYEGIYIDNVVVQGSPYLYDQTMFIDLDAGATTTITLPPFNAIPGVHDYTMNVCCEYWQQQLYQHPDDSNSLNDCLSVAFNNNAPVYIEETGLGYATIQEGIDAAFDGQTVHVQCGTFYENIQINKTITVTGEPGTATLDKTTCKYEFDHCTYLVGNVKIIPGVSVTPPEPCTCDYQLYLYDAYGDGWNGNTIDVLVNGDIVYDNIGLGSGYGPAIYPITVATGDEISIIWNGGGSWMGEPYYDLYDSEMNLIVNDWYPYYDGNWMGEASCPPCDGAGAPVLMSTLKWFDITPGYTMTTEDQAVFINASNVLVTQNTIHNVNGLVDQYTGPFTISAVRIDQVDQAIAATNVIVENNTIRNVINDNIILPPYPVNIFTQNFEGATVPNPPAGWVVENTNGDGYYWKSTSSYTAHSGTKQMYYPYYYSGGANDWFFSPGYALTAGTLYQLDWWDKVYSSSFPENLNVWLGIGQSSGAMTTMLGDYPNLVHTTFRQDIVQFTVPTTGTYYFGWHCYSLPDEFYLFIDDISLGYMAYPASYYGTADGIKVAGYIGDVDVLGNKITDIHGAGYSYGIEYATETPLPPTPPLEPCDDVTYVQFHDGYTENSLGLTSGGTITEAIQFTDTELAPYRGMEISEITVAIGCDAYGAEPGINYEVWIATSQPADPTTATVYYTGTSTSNVWHNCILDTNFEIPATGDVWVGVLFNNHPGGTYPMGFDTTTTSPTRAGYLWYVGGSWMDLNSIGYPGVWGIGIGICAGGGGGGGAVDFTANCNYFDTIGDGSIFFWNETIGFPPYPGVMFINKDNASTVTLKCNYFDNECFNWVYAIENADPEGRVLDATDNFWGKVDGPDGDPLLGPNGYVQDPITGYVADGRGANIVKAEPVMFDPWLGIHAIINAPEVITGIAGEPVELDGSGSFARCFPTCPDCCNPDEQTLQYLWDFDDGTYSANPVAMHIFDQPGTYHVSLMVDAIGFPYWNNFMYDFDYVTVEVSAANAPLDANADGGNLDGTYETSVTSAVTLYASATGGKAPYFYSWDFGDGTSTSVGSREPTITHGYREPGTYTVTLTVVDMNGDTATDTSTVIVYDVDELVVNIGGDIKVSQGDSIKFTSTVAGGVGPYTYSWNFGDGIISNQATPTHIFENSGTYTVSLTVIDSRSQQQTKTKTVTVSTTEETKEVEINNVKGGLGVRATISTAAEVSWSIEIKGNVFLGGSASGVAEQGITQIKLPFTIALGKVDIRIAAGTTVKQYSAVMVGPIVLNVKEK